jgi:hypothetical protein
MGLSVIEFVVCETCEVEVRDNWTGLSVTDVDFCEPVGVCGLPGMS